MDKAGLVKKKKDFQFQEFHFASDAIEKCNDCNLGHKCPKHKHFVMGIIEESKQHSAEKSSVHAKRQKMQKKQYSFMNLDFLSKKKGSDFSSQSK